MLIKDVEVEIFRQGYSSEINVFIRYLNIYSQS